LLLATNSEGNTAWQLAEKIGNVSLLNIWPSIRYNLLREEIKNKLLATNSEGNTAWPLA
jgi:hypothetical protein